MSYSVQIKALIKFKPYLINERQETIQIKIEQCPNPSVEWSKRFGKWDVRKDMKLIILSFYVLISIFSWADCEYSHYNLIEVDYTEKGVELYTQLTIGSGTNGQIKGASEGTGSFTFAFYSEEHSVLKAFSPKRIEGKNTGCVNSGIMHLAGFNGANHMLTYSSNECKFTCVNSELKCGPMQLEVYNFKFVFDEVPDSIRVFGIEGNGNPYAGCYNSPKMLLNFSNPKLGFRGYRAVNRNSSVETIWTVEKGALSKVFEIQRAEDNGEYNTINKVKPHIGSNSKMVYSYLDNDLIPGKYKYRIKHKDWFGNEEMSKELFVKIEANSMLVSLNENSGWIEVKLKKKKPDDIVLYNFDLEEIHQDMRLFKGTLKIKNEGLIPGIYHLKISYKNEYSLTKLVVL